MATTRGVSRRDVPHPTTVHLTETAQLPRTETGAVREAFGRDSVRLDRPLDILADGPGRSHEQQAPSMVVAAAESRE